MMCVFAGLGVLMLAGAVQMYRVDELGLAFILGSIAFMCFGVIGDDFLPDRINVSVRNQVLAHDGQGHYLVKASTSYNILGPRTHVTANLPFGLWSIGKGLWIMDTTGGTDPTEKKIEWLPMNGTYHVEPRGNSQTGGFLRELMEGYDEHQYIVEDK